MGEREAQVKLFAPDGSLPGPTWLWVIVCVVLFVLAHVEW